MQGRIHRKSHSDWQWRQASIQILPRCWRFYQQSIFNNLSAGLYTFKIADSNNCQKAIQVTLIEPTNKISLSFETQDASCLGAQNGWAIVHASGGTKPYSYAWNTLPIQIKDTAFSIPAGRISVLVRDSNNCLLADSTTIGYRPVYNNESICVVSTDTATGAHKIIWNKTADKGIASYRIFGSINSSTNFNLLDSVSFLADPIYTDISAASSNRKYFYQIRAVDSCGNESSASSSEANVFLSGTKNMGTTYLFWDNFLGSNSLQNINIWRSNNGAAFTQIANLPATEIDFSDSLAPSGINAYYLELVSMPSCNFLIAGNGKFTSNKIIPLSTSLAEKNKESYFRIFPNPSSGLINISSSSTAQAIENIDIDIYNAQGAKSTFLGVTTNLEILNLTYMN